MKDKSTNRSSRHEKGKMGSNAKSKSNPFLQDLMECLKYIGKYHGFKLTGKDAIYTKWLKKREKEILRTAELEEAFMFHHAAVMVAQMEMLYDAMESAIRYNFPEVDVDYFFRNITIYLGKNIKGGYNYLTDWKTFMFTLGSYFPNIRIFPILGFHYNLRVLYLGLLAIETKDGQPIALIPVLPNSEKKIDFIYPQNGEPLENGNLEYTWEKWYELNRLRGMEKNWLKILKYYDEILEYMVSHELFNRKKINITMKDRDID